jgi:hypothetical protein
MFLQTISILKLTQTEDLAGFYVLQTISILKLAKTEDLAGFYVSPNYLHS